MKKILLAEDSPLILRMARTFLESRGYEVITATDGISALEKAYQTNPHAIILDLVMPRLQGTQVCRLLRDHPPLKKIPMVMLTAKTQDIHKYWSLVSGIDGYFGKPQGLEELQHTFEEILHFLEEKSSENPGLPQDLYGPIEDAFPYLGERLYENLVMDSLKRQFTRHLFGKNTVAQLAIGALKFIESIFGTHLYFLQIDDGKQVSIFFLSPFVRGAVEIEKAMEILEDSYFQIFQKNLPANARRYYEKTEGADEKIKFSANHHHLAPLCYKSCGFALSTCPVLRDQKLEGCTYDPKGLLGIVSNEPFLAEISMIMGVISKTLAGMINSAILQRDRESLAPLKAYKTFLQTLNETKTMEEMLDKGLREIGAFSDSQVGILFLLDEKTASLLPKATCGLADTEKLHRSYRLGEWPVGEVAKKKEMVALQACEQSLLEIDTGLGKISARGTLIIPVIFQEKCLGVMALGSIHPYSQNHLAHILSMVKQMAIGIHNAKETRKVEEGRYKIEFLARLNQGLRKPLDQMIHYNSLVLSELQDQLPPEKLENLSRADQSARGLGQLVHSILDFSTLETGQLSITWEKVSMEELLKRCKIMAEGIKKTDGLVLKWEVSQDLPMVESDPTRLLQILSNLLSNAVKFTEQGYVALSGHCENESVCIEIEDSGLGISEEKMESIFKPFQQADLSVTKHFGGTGLGLAITKKLCEILGIELKVRSELGRGTTFSLGIPLQKTELVGGSD